MSDNSPSATGNAGALATGTQVRWDACARTPSSPGLLLSTMDLPLPTPQSSPLLRDLLTFARLLRTRGLPVSTDRVMTLVEALQYVDLTQRNDVRAACRASLVGRSDDFETFDAAFTEFWLGAGEGLGTEAPHLDRGSLSLPPERPESDHEGVPGTGRSIVPPPARTTVELAESDGPGDGASYSASESLSEKDFATLSADELVAARRFIAELKWTLATRPSRRSQPDRHGERLDLRRSLRHSMRHGGELVDLAWRGPGTQRRHIVLLCDISGSMEAYTRLLLHFLHAMERGLQRVEVFLFATRLSRVTHELRRRDTDAAIAQVTDRVHDWSGGTRIGGSLHTFNRSWARRVLGQGAIVIVISDGWDRGDPALLATELARLQRSSYRLIWLNPLLGHDDYRPLTRGMAAALPFIDNFLPVHNLQSLTALGLVLDDIQSGRPPRAGRKVS